MLLDEASEDGLRGGSFFNRRLLSNPFSRGEGAGLALGEAGSWGCEGAGRSVKQAESRTFILKPKRVLTSLETSTTKLSSLFSPSLS